MEAEKAKLERELAELGRRNPEIPGDWEPLPPETEPEGEPDKNIAADMVESFEEAAATEGELEKRLSEVSAALKRISAGTYGVCRVCQKPIEEKRLLANPAAATCISHRNE